MIWNLNLHAEKIVIIITGHIEWNMRNFNEIFWGLTLFWLKTTTLMKKTRLVLYPRNKSLNNVDQFGISCLKFSFRNFQIFRVESQHIFAYFQGPIRMLLVLIVI